MRREHAIAGPNRVNSRRRHCYAIPEGEGLRVLPYGMPIDWDDPITSITSTKSRKLEFGDKYSNEKGEAHVHGLTDLSHGTRIRMSYAEYLKIQKERMWMD